MRATSRLDAQEVARQVAAFGQPSQDGAGNEQRGSPGRRITIDKRRAQLVEQANAVFAAEVGWQGRAAEGVVRNHSSKVAGGQSHTVQRRKREPISQTK